MSRDDLLCQCGSGVVYHLGGWVCLSSGVPPWHCELKPNARRKSGKKSGSTRPAGDAAEGKH